MSWTIRMDASMVDAIRLDLRRPHSHAYERVGFVYARMGNREGPELQILPVRYEAVPDEDYLEDEEVGACIGSAAIRRAMQTALSSSVGVLHVHQHQHRGMPRFSHVDLKGYAALVPAFQRVSRACAHGALLLSDDSCESLIWMPGQAAPSSGGRIVLVGRPMRFIVSEGVRHG